MPLPVEQLKDAIKQALPDLDLVLAWERGPDNLSHTPLFITSEEDVDRVAWDPRCSVNLAGYLPGLKGKKVGIVAKGCDARSLVELLQEKFVNREDVIIFGLHCQGTVDAERARTALSLPREAVPEYLEIDGGVVQLKVGIEVMAVPLGEGLMDKCFRCTGADADPCDYFLGEHGPTPIAEPAQPCTLERLEVMEPEERFRFWERTMESCIRCYACRSACPLCVCQDHCAAQSRDPKWVDQTDHPREKLMFQVMHALHTAGRCTECGECERACPMNLPIMTMKQALNQQIKDLFDYQAGMDPEATPPLFQFREEEAKIKEKQW